MSQLAGLQPWLRPAAEWFVAQLNAAGYRPRITSVVRTTQQQSVLYQRYLRGLSRFPAAPPGRSLHEQGRAFDMVVVDPATAGAYWKSMGGRWYASDPIHFEA